MRALVNRFGDYLAEDTDFAGFLLRVGSVLGIVAIVIVMGVVVLGAIFNHNAPQHGSCKIEHWAGKSYVCDEYYPLPVKR